MRHSDLPFGYSSRDLFCFSLPTEIRGRGFGRCTFSPDVDNVSAGMACRCGNSGRSLRSIIGYDLRHGTRATPVGVTRCRDLIPFKACSNVPDFFHANGSEKSRGSIEWESVGVFCEECEGNKHVNTSLLNGITPPSNCISMEWPFELVLHRFDLPRFFFEPIQTMNAEKGQGFRICNVTLSHLVIGIGGLISAISS